jgi:hypothetical protein
VRATKGGTTELESPGDGQRPETSIEGKRLAGPREPTKRLFADAVGAFHREDDHHSTALSGLVVGFGHRDNTRTAPNPPPASLELPPRTADQPGEGSAGDPQQRAVEQSEPPVGRGAISFAPGTVQELDVSGCRRCALHSRPDRWRIGVAHGRQACCTG